MQAIGNSKKPVSVVVFSLFKNVTSKNLCLLLNNSKSSQSLSVDKNWQKYLSFNSNCNTDFQQSLIKGMRVMEDFLNDDEEKSLLQELEPYLTTLHYEFDHWDNAIHGYRETERLKWNENNSAILQRVRQHAFPPGTPQLKFVHVLDLAEEGYIKPHIDSVRFCGNTIAGLSLLSNSVMRLVHHEHQEISADVLLKQKSLYIMTGTTRYDFTHEVLSNDHSKFGDEVIHKSRRISVICRNEPSPEFLHSPSNDDDSSA